MPYAATHNRHFRNINSNWKINCYNQQSKFVSNSHGIIDWPEARNAFQFQSSLYNDVDAFNRKLPGKLIDPKFWLDCFFFWFLYWWVQLMFCDDMISKFIVQFPFLLLYSKLVEHQSLTKFYWKFQNCIDDSWLLN